MNSVLWPLREPFKRSSVFLEELSGLSGCLSGGGVGCNVYGETY
jgi:hypothetical protein